MIIENCEITKSNAEILIPYIGSTKSGDYKRYGFLHDGITLKATTIYSPIFTTVLRIEKDMKGSFSVVLKYEHHSVIRICNLDSCSVSNGQLVPSAYSLGDARYGKCRVEYANEYKEDSKFILHLDSKVYYKHDPTSILAIGFTNYRGH